MRKIALAVIALSFATPAHAASGKNNYIRNLLVNKLFRGDATALPTQFEIRLYPAGTCPTATTAGTELSGNGYAAITCTASTAGTACNSGTANWEATNGGGGAASTGLIKNTNALTFPTVTTSSWSVQCVAITAGGAANVMYFGDLTSAPVTVGVGATASFAADALTVQEQ